MTPTLAISSPGLLPGHNSCVFFLIHDLKQFLHARMTYSTKYQNRSGLITVDSDHLSQVWSDFLISE